MLRFTLATRLGLIAIVGFSAISIIMIGILYLTTIRENEDARPSPGRLAALAELIERTAPETRQLMLAAVSSPQFSARVEGVTGPDPASTLVEKAVRARYAAALVGRHIAVTDVPGEQRFPRLAKWMANALEFRIGLHTGETLVVDTSTRLPVTRLGLPVGFGAGLFGTIVALLALLVMQRETRPLALLAAAVDRVDLSADPPPLPDARRSAPEIRAVIGAFNHLQRRLNEMLRARMTLIGGIAHDVRTFATRLRFARGTNSGSGRTGARRRRYRRHDPAARRRVVVEPRRRRRADAGDGGVFRAGAYRCRGPPARRAKPWI